MAYATTSDVQDRTPGRTISLTSLPNTSQVSAWIVQTEAMLNGALRAAEIYQDFTGDALEILKSWVVDRVSGLVRMAYASAGGDGSNDDGKDLVAGFDKLIEDIRRDPAWIGAQLAGGSPPEAASHVRGSNADGAIEPIFTTGMEW